MPDGLYDRDILVWSEQQAALLRRLASGERPNDIDWENLIEEIESVGRSELHACESHLRQALVHLLKQHRWPDSDALEHWRSETIGFLANAERSFSPSMRQRIDLQKQYRSALKQVGSGPTNPSRAAVALCPYTLDDLIDPESDIPRLVALLGPA